MPSLDPQPLREYFLGPMATRRILSAALFIVSHAAAVSAADTLGLDEAIRQAVERNFDLSLSHDQREAATAARQGGVGQFLPSASANASTGGDVSGGSPVTTIGASATWVLFDGLQNVNGYRRLEAQEQAATLQERID